jgi:hypothetical protein
VDILYRPALYCVWPLSHLTLFRHSYHSIAGAAEQQTVPYTDPVHQYSMENPTDQVPKEKINVQACRNFGLENKDKRLKTIDSLSSDKAHLWFQYKNETTYGICAICQKWKTPFQCMSCEEVYLCGPVANQPFATCLNAHRHQHHLPPIIKDEVHRRKCCICNKNSITYKCGNCGEHICINKLYCVAKHNEAGCVKVPVSPTQLAESMGQLAINHPPHASGPLLYACGMEDLDGNTTNTFLLVEMNLPHIDKLACGKEHILVLANGGKAYAWGDSEYGQCGELSDELFYPTNPFEIKKDNVDDIACCGICSAILVDGQVLFMGALLSATSKTPLSIKGDDCSVLEILEGRKAVKIGAGSSFVAATLSDQTLVMWGSWEDDFDELTKTCTPVQFSADSIPRSQTILSWHPTVINIACGGFHLLVVAVDPATNEKNVYSAGRNDFGQLGHGDCDRRTELTKVRS